MSDTTLQDEYQEQVIENLEDISDSVSDEKKFRQEVLTEIKSVKKSVDALQEDDFVNLPITLIYSSRRFQFSSVNKTFKAIVAGNSNIRIYYCPISNIENFYIKSTDNSNYFVDTVLTSVGTFTTNTDYTCDYANSFNVSTFNDGYKFINYTNSKYFYIGLDLNEISINNLQVYYLKSENPNSDNNITVETIDYTDGINNITEILTFQSFATALVLGILLFLIFIKGLRK